MTQELKSFRIKDKPTVSHLQINDDTRLLIEHDNQYKKFTIGQLKQYLQTNKDSNEIETNWIFDQTNNPIIQNGILRCKFDSSVTSISTAASAIPSFLQFCEIEGRQYVIIYASDEEPLTLLFALGIENNQWKNKIVSLTSNRYLQLDDNNYIYAELDNDENIIIGKFDKSINYTHQLEEPNNPQSDMHWFDIKNNQMKKYDGSNWIDIYRIILGTVVNGETMSFVPNIIYKTY